MARQIPALSVLALTIALNATASAQTVSTTGGTILGTVTDSTKGVLPGVLVTLSGPAVMGTPSVVTDDSGRYRFPALGPGEYRVKFDLSGFGQVVREGIRVGAGFTATVNVELQPGALAETLTVTGSSPIIDTQATNVATRFDAERLANLPSGSRDVWSVLAQAPAVSMSRVDVGGSNALTQQPYTAYGLSSAGGVNRSEVEGILVNEGAGGGGSDMYYTDYGSFAEIAVNAVGNTAQMPAPGVLTQLIGKSGGNTYRGSFYFDFQNESMEAHNIDDEQIAMGIQGSPALDVTDINRLSLFRDVSVDLGGFVIKDRLWWYGAYRHTVTDQRYPTLIDDIQHTTVPVWTAKGTFNLTQNHKLIPYYQGYEKDQPDYLGAIRIGGGRNTTARMTADSVWHSRSRRHVWKFEYNGVLSNASFVEVRVGDMSPNPWKRTSKSPEQRVEDIAANAVSGGVYDIDSYRRRPQVNGALTYTKNGWAGTHNLKAGGEIMNDVVDTDFFGFPHPSNSVSVLNNGLASQVDIYASPNRSTSGTWTTAGYVSDSWQMHSRLTLNIGVRFDRHRAYLPSQSGPGGQTFAELDNAVDFHDFGPRIGASWLLSDARPTTLKVNYGRYWLYPGSGLGAALNPNASMWFERYAWSDLNANGRWERGEEGRLVSVQGGSTSTVFDDNLKNAYVQQATVYVEREIVGNFGVRTGFVWNGRRQERGTIDVNRPLSAYDVPVSIVDPGPDGRLNTADDGATITAYNLNAAVLSRPPQNITTNLPGVESDYYTWELTANKRDNGRVGLSASFAHTWNADAALGAGSSYTPNALINADGDRLRTTTWQGKLHATINLGRDYRVVPSLRHQSGTPFARTFVQTLNWGNATINSQPVSDNRIPNVTVLDLRLDKSFQISRLGRLNGFVDVYNVFNTNAEQALTTSSGAAYLRPSVITPPRIARVGVRLDW